MYKNVAINWDVFQYKFSENPTNAFEQLSYMLFCYEFEQPFGIFRYFNQPHVETNPIRVGKDYIAFQAKYYDATTKLSTKVNELKRAIEGAKNKYLGINKIIFYTNKELSTSPKETEVKPSYQIDVEKFGESIGVAVDWRVRSNFEIMLFSPELEAIRDYYFNPEDGIKGYIDNIKFHSENILNNINSSIECRGKKIKIENSYFDLLSFIESSEKCFFLFGDGGTGKSGLIKDYIKKLDEEIPKFVFKTTDFDRESIYKFSNDFGNYNFNDFLDIFNEYEKKIFIIDSAEKSFTMNNKDVLKEIVGMLIDKGWKIIFTIRTIYKENFKNIYLKGIACQDYEVKQLTLSDLDNIEKFNSIILPKDAKLRNLLCNLFYLGLYIDMLPEKIEGDNSIEKFIECIWNEKIRNISMNDNNMHIRRENEICKIVLSNANLGVSYYELTHEDDNEAICKLVESGVLNYDQSMNGYCLSHDVYEELVIKYIIQRKFKSSISPKEVFAYIGDSLVVRKTFRLWIQDMIKNEYQMIQQIIITILHAKDIDSIWKDETLLAIMVLNDSKDYLNLITQILNRNNFELLFRVIFILSTACRCIDDELISEVLTTEEQRSYSIYRYTRPSGQAWEFAFEYLYKNIFLIELSDKNIAIIINVLYEWTSNYKIGNTTRFAGLIAIYLYEKIKEDDSLKYSVGNKVFEKVIKTILLSSYEINEKITNIIQRGIDIKDFNYNSKYFEIYKYALSDIGKCGNLSRSNPKLVIDLARCFWLYTDSNIDIYSSEKELENAFGINKSLYEYFPSSSFKTPMFILLQYDPKETLNFIIEFFNYITDKYKESYLQKDYRECQTIKIYTQDGSIIHQVASKRLWLMHRGVSASPNLLESILMALERWLYLFIKEETKENSLLICNELLSKSNSVAITSVVVSMVIAYPEKLSEIACLFVNTKEIFILDTIRFNAEESTGFLMGINKNNIFENERIKANSFPFRKKKLQDIILEYQANGGILLDKEKSEILKKLYSNFDKVFSKIDELEEELQFIYYKMDLRKMKPDVDNTVEKDDKICMPLVPELPDNLLQFRKNKEENNNKMFKYIEFGMWGKDRFEKKHIEYNRYEYYEKNPREVFKEVKFMLDNKDKFSLLEKNNLIYVLSILVRDFKGLLLKDEYEYCSKILLEYSFSIIENNISCKIHDDFKVAISMLPLLISYSENKDEVSFNNPIILLLLLILGRGEARDIAITEFSSQLWKLSFDSAEKLFNLYVILKPIYDNEVLIFNGITPIEFIEKNKKLIEENFNNNKWYENEFSLLNINSLMVASMLLSSEISYFAETINKLGEVIWRDLFSDNKIGERLNLREYSLELNYISWLANNIIMLPQAEQVKVVQNLKQYLNICNNTENLFRDIILVNDRVDKYDCFWNTWNMLKMRIVELCKKRESIDKNIEKDSIYYKDDLNQIVTTYLLAFPYWSDNIKKWHGLKEENAIFFKEMSEDIGFNSAVIYSIGRVLNTIGYDFFEQGIDWLYTIVENNSHLKEVQLQTDTEFYIEEYMQRYLLEYKLNLNKNPVIRKKVITILSFLVDRGSTCAFMLREEII